MKLQNAKNSVRKVVSKNQFGMISLLGTCTAGKPSLIKKNYFKKLVFVINLYFQGDIVVGPYICHGIESENKALFKTQNKLPTHGADQISKYNVTAAIHELFTGQKVRLKKLDFQFSKTIIF